MRRAGFTLIEIMIVVGIIAIMLASAVMSVASGRGAVQVKEATRGVIQLSRYASALALLRQRPVVVTFFKDGKVEVRISGEAIGSDAVGKPADPLYREVDGRVTLTAAEFQAENSEDEYAESEAAKGKGGSPKGADSSAASPGEKNAYFYTKRVLDLDALAKEDAYGEYEGVTFKVEVLGEDGEPLDPAAAAALSLPRPERKSASDASLFMDGVQVWDSGEQADEKQQPGAEDAPVSVTYETNGNVNPHRIIIRQEGESDVEEGFAINISRSGKATVGDDEEEGSRHARRRRR